MIVSYGAPGGVTQSFPEIIKQASSSTLGIFALMILLLGCLAYVFFRKAPVKTRQWIFLSLLAGATMYGIAITRIATGSPSVIPDPDAQTAIVLVGTVVDAETSHTIANAQVVVDGQGILGTSDSNGEFHVQIKSSPSSVPIRLRVSRQGYEPVAWDVRLPATNLTITLSRAKQ